MYTQTVYILTRQGRAGFMPDVMEREKRAERVDLRIRSNEKEFLKAAADAAGLTLSGFIVSSALREAHKITKTTLTTPEQAAAFGELKSPAPKTAVASLRKARRYPTR